jgi:nucleoside phosphorylase
MRKIKQVKSILCVAAANTEFGAIKKYLDDEFSVGKVWPIPSIDDYVLHYVDPSNSIDWYLAGMSFQGETEVAIGAGRLNSAISPTITLMVGMCMGMPGRHYPTGTVVVPNEVVSFDHTRVNVRGTQYRPHGQKVSKGLHKLAKIVASNPDLGFKTIVDKGLASANSKVENPKGSLIKFIAKAFPDAAAYDMEGWGFYSALDGRDCLWIKAVADAGEPQSPSSAGQDDKQTVQRAVTSNAISFAVRLVRTYIIAALESRQTAAKSSKDSAQDKKEALDDPSTITSDFQYRIAEETVTYTVKMRSLAMDVVKVHAHSHIVGVQAEYQWASHFYPGYTCISQSLTTLELLTTQGAYESSQVHFDVLKIELANGRVKEIYFDISSFLTGGAKSSLTDKDAFAARKLTELYNVQ